MHAQHTFLYNMATVFSFLHYNSVHLPSPPMPVRANQVKNPRYNTNAKNGIAGGPSAKWQRMATETEQVGKEYTFGNEMNCRPFKSPSTSSPLMLFCIQIVLFVQGKSFFFFFFPFIKFLLEDSIRKWGREWVQCGWCTNGGQDNKNKSKSEAKVIGYIIELDPPNIQPHDACIAKLSSIRYDTSLYTIGFILWILSLSCVKFFRFITYLTRSSFPFSFSLIFAVVATTEQGTSSQKKIGMEILCLMVMGYGCDLVDHEKSIIMYSFCHQLLFSSRKCYGVKSILLVYILPTNEYDMALSFCVDGHICILRQWNSKI